MGTAAAGGRFHAWPPTECRPQRGPRCWLWRGEAGPRVQTRALPHLLRAIDDRFQEERGGLPIVSLDQRSVGRHRCQLIGKDALVERDEVALGAGILEPGKLLLPVRVLCQHLLQLWHKWAGSGRPSVPCRGPAGNQSRRVPPPRRQGQGRHAPAARAPCAAGALTLARSGAVMQALAACDASLRQAHVLREGPALHGPSDHPSTPARPAQSPDRTGCSSVLWAARRIPRFPHLLRVAPAPEKARGSGADRPDQGLRAAWWVGTGTAVPAPALSPLPVRMLVMCKGFRAT